MYDLSVVGDALIDFTPLEVQGNEKPVFECNAGGTASNMAVGAARLGLKTRFVGKVGDDIMGRHLHDFLRERGVDVSMVSFSPAHFTTMAFVMLQNGERSFSFSRKFSADTELSLDDFDVDTVLDAKMLHVTGMSFNDEPICATNFHLLEKARARGVMTTIDVNYRPSLWRSELFFVEQMQKVVPMIDLYKSSEEEAMLITGKDTVEAAAEAILCHGPKLVAVSCGPKGAYFLHAGGSGHLNTYDTVRVDTTGAGDCFMSALLLRIRQRGGLDSLTNAELRAIFDFANAAGAVSVSKRGGAYSMPVLDDVLHCMKTQEKLVIPW